MQLLIWLSHEVLLSISVQLFVTATNSALASTDKTDPVSQRLCSFRMTDGGHCKDGLLFEVQSLALLTDTLLCKLFNGNELNNN
jgi:hypothetical protein